MRDREKLVYTAKLAEQAERYEEMASTMTDVAKSAEDCLTEDERNLLSVAFKNVVGVRRASWRVLSSLEQRDQEGEAAASSRGLALAREYREQVEVELKERCQQLLQLLTEHVLPKCSDEEASVFFHKMAGDYHRYLAEFASGAERKEVAENSLLEYKAATDIAIIHLPPTHPIRLGLALNFSVFYYEILNSPDRACRLAKAAFDDAINELDKLPEQNYKDSTLIMQLLRDNLTLWTSDMQAGDSADNDGADADALKTEGEASADAVKADGIKAEPRQEEISQPA